jgi:5'-nucleotidase
MNSAEKESFRIIHFNDVYDLQPGEKEPIGGVAHFKTAIDQYKTSNTLVLFSGDVFSPSVLSNVYKGHQMIEPMNSFGIDAACLGNHDFDYPIDHVMKLIK